MQLTKDKRSGEGIVIVYDGATYVKRIEAHSPNYTTKKRVIYSAEKVRDHECKGMPKVIVSFRNKFAWADGLQWSLWQATCHVLNDWQTIYGWSFDGKMPLVWAYNGVMGMVGTPHEDIALYQWQTKWDMVPVGGIDPALADPSQLAIVKVLRRHQLGDVDALLNSIKGG